MFHGRCDYHKNGGNVMAKKMDAEQIERGRQKGTISFIQLRLVEESIVQFDIAHLINGK